jgi:hypothetical protein
VPGIARLLQPGRHAANRTRCAFEKIGFRIARQSGHIIMSNGKIRLVIPRHNPINAITMGGIAKAAGLTKTIQGSLVSFSIRISKWWPTPPMKLARCW